MGTRWKVVAREAGYDPNKAKEAPLSGGKWRAYIEVVDMKDARIGNPTDCSGARCIKRAMPADWAYVGASSAFVVPTGSKTIMRYLVNGVAKRQDRTMSVVGEEVILRPPPVKAQRETKREKDKAKRSKPVVLPEGGSPSRKRSTPKKRSIAAQLRGAA